MTDASGGFTPRIQKLTPTGHFLWMIGGEVDKSTGADLCTAASEDECGAPVAGSGPGQFGDFPYGPAIAIDPAGDLLVASGERIQRFNPEGAYQGEIEAAGAGSEHPLSALAVAPGGDLYTYYGAQRDVLKLDPTTGEALATLSVDRPRELATDPAGDVFVAARSGNFGDKEQEEFEQEGSETRLRERVIEFGPEGARLSVFAEVELIPGAGEHRYSIGGLGTNALGDLYVSNYESSLQGAFVRFFGPPPISYEAPPLRPPRSPPSTPPRSPPTKPSCGRRSIPSSGTTPPSTSSTAPPLAKKAAAPKPKMSASPKQSRAPR